MKQLSNTPHFNSPHSSLHRRFSSKLSIFLPAILLLVICSCKKTELQDNTNNPISSNAQKSDRKLKTVPFKASFITMDEMTQEATETNPIQKDRLTGTGVGTEIGRASEVTDAEGDVTLPFPALITSTTTIIAANGDKIFTTNDGYLQEPSPEGNLHISGSCSVTGGTGRFTGATGSLTFDATGNIFQAEGAVTFNGTISY